MSKWTPAIYLLFLISGICLGSVIRQIDKDAKNAERITQLEHAVADLRDQRAKPILNALPPAPELLTLLPASAESSSYHVTVPIFRK